MKLSYEESKRMRKNADLLGGDLSFALKLLELGNFSEAEETLERAYARQREAYADIMKLLEAV